MNLYFKSAVVLSSLFIVGQANAASISYDLTYSNDLANGATYATVVIDDQGTVGDVNFTVTVNAAAFPAPLALPDNFGMQTFSFNYDSALDAPVGNIGASNIVDIDPTSWGISDDKGAGGGFGNFEFEAKADGGNDRTQVLTFSISGVAGDTVNSYAVGYTPESDAYFASHIAGYDDGVSGNTSGKFASVVPVPAAVWLLGSALGMLGWMCRRSSAVS
jgi:hypothetical protein